MKSSRIVGPALSVMVVAIAAIALASTPAKKTEKATVKTTTTTPEHIIKTDAEWKKQLTPEQYRVLRHEGTEIAFTGQYWDTHSNGTYVCAACGYELFSSKEKFDSGTGWPSFWKPLIEEHIKGNGASRWVGEEIKCARCGGHLGHVFTDGPKPTGLRYCINSVSLKFIPAK